MGPVTSRAQRMDELIQRRWTRGIESTGQLIGGPDRDRQARIFTQIAQQALRLRSDRSWFLVKWISQESIQNVGILEGTDP